MAQMQALLKIKADVDGEGKVNSLGRAIGGLSNTAGRVSGGLKGLAGAAGGLSGALGALVPIATGAGLATMAKGAIDAADNMNDLSQKTGVSVESLSKFQQAANASGTSIEGVGAAMIKLNKGLAAGTGPAADALRALGLSATDASGKLKTTDAVMLEVADKFKVMPDGAEKTALALQLFGKAGADMVPLLNGGSKAVTDLSATMTTEFARGADSLNDKLAALQGKLLQLGVTVGTALMPALNVISDLILGLANAFAAMPGPIQVIVGGVVALAAAFVLLAPAIAAIASLAPVITAAFTGLLAFLSSTFFPAVFAFFSGPAGWTVLAVAAVVAMAIAFRKPLTDFALWLVGWGKPIGQFFKGLWDGTVQTAKTAAAAVQSVFMAIPNVIKGAMNGVLSGVFNSVNATINNINSLINRANSLSAKVKGPQLPTLPTLPVPQFAQGGVVNRPTLAMVGEGGEPEYIIPQSKMAAASANYLRGARGGAVIPALAPGGYAGGGNAQIDVTTGPVMQQGGQLWVTMADLEKAMRQTADGIYATLRTPAGRYATGVR